MRRALTRRRVEDLVGAGGPVLHAGMCIKKLGEQAIWEQHRGVTRNRRLSWELWGAVAEVVRAVGRLMGSEVAWKTRRT